MTERKIALITGITGQDGSYLAEFLLEKGYAVHGIIRRTSTFNTTRIAHIFQDPHEEAPKLFLHYGDLADELALDKTIGDVLPDEIYHLGAQSHVRVSFDIPAYTIDTVGQGTLRVLESIRRRREEKEIRFYQAGSSEMFGSVTEIPQRETTPFRPRSPYACGKVLAHMLTVNYRESYGLHASNGILFNHESPRRGETFVTRKITRGIAQILAGKVDKIFLGNLTAQRDWGYAKDYVEAMWLMLQQPQPDDYVVATGESRTVQEFLEEAFSLVGLSWEKHVEIDSRYYRPTEVDVLQGDATKARRVLRWSHKTSFKELVRLMLESDLRSEGQRLEDCV